MNVPDQLVATLAELDDEALDELDAATDPSTWTATARLHGIAGFGAIQDLAVLREAGQLARRRKIAMPSLAVEEEG
jgi:hypothetical protein